MKRKTMLTMITIVIFLFSTIATSNMMAATAQNSQIETNFDLLLMTNAGNRIRESYAFFIKQAVAPLGINVQILAKPFGQFVGDLLHLSTGQPFDLAIIGFSGGGPTPSFMWKFHSTDTSFGQLMYQLNNPTWQAWQQQDTGVTTSQVDKLLESIDFELNPIVRQQRVTEFAKLYMDKLLYDLPLTTVTSRVAVWAGYGGANDSLWNPDEGLWASSWLGAKWDTNPQDRIDSKANSSTLQFRIADPGNPGNFDPYQSFDTSTTAQTTYSTMNLLTFDGSYKPHPGVAYQWFTQNVTYNIFNNGSTPQVFVPSGKQTWILNTNMQFPATTDYQGNVIPAHNVTANDIALAYQMFKNPNTNLNGKELFNPVVKWKVSTTVKTDDTFSIYLNQSLTTPDDYFTFGAMTPIPSYILGGTLHVDDPNQSGLQPNGTTYTVADSQGFNPQNSIEWQHWASQAGNTLIGPMSLAKFDLKQNKFFSFKARSDFTFPNEWDMQDMYAANPTPYDTLLTNLKSNSGDNTTGTDYSNWNIGLFAPHLEGGNSQAYYWAYDGSSSNHQKPTEQNIKYVVVKDIPDTNAALTAFDAGQLDSFTSSALGATTVQAHENDARFVVKTTYPISGPQLLVFNLLNENLKKRNVRYAIASVIDKQEMTKINDGFAVPQESPVWLVYDRFKPAAFVGAGPNGGDLSWYVPFPIAYNYATGRDLMRLEGYKARDSAKPVASVAPPPVGNVFSTLRNALGSNALIGISAFALTSAVLIKKKRRYNL